MKNNDISIYDITENRFLEVFPESPICARIEKWLSGYSSTPSLPFERKIPYNPMEQVDGFYKEWSKKRP